MTNKLGIDLGGSKTEVVVLDAQNQLLYRRRERTPADSYDAIIDLIATLVACAEAELSIEATVGIGTPGAISARTGLLRNSNTVCMNGRALLRDLQNRLRREIRLQNDANCFALSEALTGAAVAASVVFGVIIGTGTGAGLVVNGALLPGRHGIAGEWGHNPLPWHRPEDGLSDCYCGKQGCIETFLSGPGMTQSYRAGYAQCASSEAIVAAAAAGNESAVSMLERYFDQMSRALAQVINIIDPDIIVLGGGMSNIDQLYQEIPQRLGKYVFSDYVDTPIVAAMHGDASGVFGAAMLFDH